jgi:hypothetical protein
VTASEVALFVHVDAYCIYMFTAVSDNVERDTVVNYGCNHVTDHEQYLMKHY